MRYYLIGKRIFETFDDKKFKNGRIMLRLRNPKHEGMTIYKTTAVGCSCNLHGSPGITEIITCDEFEVL